MSADEIDAYLAEVTDEAQREALEDLRRMILDLVPDAEQRLSYGAPAFRVDGKVVAGFAAHARHLTYLPHSGSVVAILGDELAGRSTTKGSVKFAPDDPLPAALVEALVAARRAELAGS